MEAKQLLANYHMVVAVKGVVYVLAQRPFQIYVSKFFHKALQFPEQMVIALTTDQTLLSNAISIESQKGSRRLLKAHEKTGIKNDATTGSKMLNQNVYQTGARKSKY